MEDILYEAGLTKIEAEVYIKLCEHGKDTAYGLAKKSHLFKANTYDALKNLEEKGLVLKSSIDNKTHYEAADPSFLLSILDAKKERIGQIIPRLRLLQQTVKSESKVIMQKGTIALRDYFYHTLTFKEPFLTYGVSKTAYESVKYWIDEYHKERIKKGIKFLHIYNQEAHERFKQLKKLPLTPIRVLPSPYDSEVATTICGDEVALIMFHPQVKLIIIKDKDMADAYKRYFQILWKQARPVT